MRVPIRKPGKYSHLKPDVHLTEAKLAAMKRELERLKTVSRPAAATEVRRLAELGDFSENAAYQLAKGRLRGINQRILELEDRTKHAVLIKPSGDAGRVQLGSTVTIAINGQEKTYTILGSAETNPGRGVISHVSPLGVALMGRKVGDTILLSQGGKGTTGRIITIRT